MALDVHPSNCPEDRSPSRVALRGPPQGLEQPSTVAGTTLLASGWGTFSLSGVEGTAVVRAEAGSSSFLLAFLSSKRAQEVQGEDGRVMRGTWRLARSNIWPSSIQLLREADVVWGAREVVWSQAGGPDGRICQALVPRVPPQFNVTAQEPTVVSYQDGKAPFPLRKPTVQTHDFYQMVKLGADEELLVHLSFTAETWPPGVTP